MAGYYRQERTRVAYQQTLEEAGPKDAARIAAAYAARYM